jgi:sec-independent protein translocase protein TatB
MFDIAWSELLLIAVIALIFIGPKDLPQVLHNFGRMVAKLRRSADDFRRQFEDSVREAGYEDLHKNLQEFRSLNPANQLKDSIARAVSQEYTPKPNAPAPEQSESQQTPVQTQEALQSVTDTPPPHQDAPGTANASPAEKPVLEPASQDSHAPGEPGPHTPAGEVAKDHVAPAA